MNLTQLQTLRDAILAETDPTFVEYRTQGATGAMAAFFNAPASPAFYVWRSNYTAEQIAAAIDAGVTQLDGLSASKRESLLWWAGRNHDATQASVQAAINDLCGAQNTLKNAVLDGGKRTLLKGEKLFATGTGTLAAPGALGSFEGNIGNGDIVAALEA